MWRTGRDRLAGAVLVFVGTLLLADQRMPALVPVIPLVVGLMILVLFLVRRSPGLLLVGCALTGAGLGVLLDREGTRLAGVGVLACVAAGLGVAWVVGLLLRLPGLRVWPLLGAFVCGGLAAVVAVAGVGDELRAAAAAWWPLAVIALGLVLLAGSRAGRPGRGAEEETRQVPSVADPPD